MVREAGITTEMVEQPNHAWRHRFKTKARQYGIDIAAADAIQGHASPTEGGKYGVWPLARLAREIEKLPRYDMEELLEAD